MRAWVPVLFLLFATGCGAQVPFSDHSRHAASQDPAAHLECPSLANLPRFDEGGANARMQSGFSLARQLLSEPTPYPPSDHRYDPLQSWVDHELTPWLARRRERVADLRFEFGLREDSDAEVRVVARAVVGIVLENTAQVLKRVPTPIELDNEPEVAKLFHEIVDTEAEPFRQSALKEYKACARTGYDEGDELLKFADFCGARVERLRIRRQQRTASR